MYTSPFSVEVVKKTNNLYIPDLKKAFQYALKGFFGLNNVCSRCCQLKAIALNLNCNPFLKD